MLKALQRAHYRNGLRIVETPTIMEVAQSIGLNADQFAGAFETVSKRELAGHLESTHELMRKIDAYGFPTFVAQAGAHLEVLPHERFYGNAEGFGDIVAGLLAPKHLVTVHD